MKKIILTFALIIFSNILFCQTAKDYLLKAVKLWNKKEYKVVIQNFNKAIKLEPQNVEAYNGRGISKGYLKNDTGAIQDFNKAIELEPKIAEK